MESKIKWQTGIPKEGAWYLVTLKSGIVCTDLFIPEINAWYNYNEYIDPIIAFCKLNDIEPYKE